jgi:nicotinate-nucleotide adenylyltransferase
MRIGLYGGSFDPVHYGHIRPVLEAKKLLSIDRVYYLPTARPPHKPDRQFAPPHARFAMVELALLGEPDLLVSALELTPDRPAFTVESVEHFRRLHPDAEIFLLIGGDCLADLQSWHRWRDLVASVHLAVLIRPGWEFDRVRAELSPEVEEAIASERVHFVANPPVEVSSTRIREAMARGEEVSATAMPRLVLEYLRKYSLYS